MRFEMHPIQTKLLVQGMKLWSMTGFRNERWERMSKTCVCCQGGRLGGIPTTWRHGGSDLDLRGL